MRKNIRCLLLVTVGVGIAGSAGAGDKIANDVVIDRSQQPWRASGSLGSARNIPTSPAGANKEIGCRVETYLGKPSKVTCTAYAPNTQTGSGSLQAECISFDPRFVAAATALNGDSKITFEAYDGISDYAAAGVCTSICVENVSHFEPKEP